MSGGTAKTDPCRHNKRRPPRSAISGRRTTEFPRGNMGRESKHNDRLHRASCPNTSPPHRPLHVTSGRLHPLFSKNRRLELGRPTCVTNDMAQGVPVPNTPRSKIPPSLGDSRPHQSRTTSPAEAAGTAHHHRAGHTRPDLYCAPSTTSHTDWNSIGADLANKLALSHQHK